MNEKYAGSSGDASEEDTELADYVTGAKEVPLPTYFIGSFGQGAERAIESLSDADAPVRYLGRSGIKQLHGLNVAYLDGAYDKRAFEDGSTITASCRHYSKVGAGWTCSCNQALCLQTSSALEGMCMQ